MTFFTVCGIVCIWAARPTAVSAAAGLYFISGKQIKASNLFSDKYNIRGVIYEVLSSNG